MQIQDIEFRVVWRRHENTGYGESVLQLRKLKEQRVQQWTEYGPTWVDAKEWSEWQDVPFAGDEENLK
jgi:hypothetical protein